MYGRENAFPLDDKSCTVKLLVAMVALFFFHTKVAGALQFQNFCLVERVVYTSIKNK